ncbi:hypothetical protein [uncultured Novosphingobium sp.]|uniref:Transposase n=1 Tax=Novosphingobium clariflavum TaxID=2029884 RepID=A0ABV6SCK8_9SPHN|nr:hypothetical protein [uncultured Novosphingobium sp.]
MATLIAGVGMILKFRFCVAAQGMPCSASALASRGKQRVWWHLAERWANDLSSVRRTIYRRQAEWSGNAVAGWIDEAHQAFENRRFLGK